MENQRTKAKEICEYSHAGNLSRTRGQLLEMDDWSLDRGDEEYIA